ncbi:MAG TPA: hypothetical protein VKH81_15145 [Candidatus Angelobacter sp.]|nr:hypothetical protein [Candidatus Angelobacter sp.]
MFRPSRVAFIFTALIGLSFNALSAQEYDPDAKLNTNLAFPVIVPVGSTSDFAHLGTGMVVGAGYNFNQHHAFVGEFLWSWLYPTEESLEPLRPGTPTGDLNGHSNLFVLTANYRLEFHRRRFGGYLIGGGGYYYRNASRTEVVTPAAGTPCTAVWQWWGFRCSGGTVIVSQTTSSFPGGLFGGNAGVGFTFAPSGESRYRMYIEGRYHYAPSSTFPLRFIPITIGVRY